MEEREYTQQEAREGELYHGHHGFFFSSLRVLFVGVSCVNLPKGRKMGRMEVCPLAFALLPWLGIIVRK